MTSQEAWIEALEEDFQLHPPTEAEVASVLKELEDYA